MLKRFDFHVHSFFSKDACNSPEDLIASAQKRGLSGIAITDHDSCEAHEYLRGRPIPDNFLLIPGVEVSTAEGHMLCIGATLPYLKKQPAKKVFEEIKKAGGIAIPAHPYDAWRAGIREEILDTLPLEVLEVFNAATSEKSNAKALAYAQKRGLSMTAASDAHHSSAVGVSSTELDIEELTLPTVLAALRQGGRPDGKYLNFGESVKKNFGNWFRIFNKRPRL